MTFYPNYVASQIAIQTKVQFLSSLPRYIASFKSIRSRQLHPIPIAAFHSRTTYQNIDNNFKNTLPKHLAIIH